MMFAPVPVTFTLLDEELTHDRGYMLYHAMGQCLDTMSQLRACRDKGAVSCSTVRALPCYGAMFGYHEPITGMPRQGRRQRHTVPDRYLFLPVQKGSSLPGSVVKYCSRRANQYPPFSRQQKARTNVQASVTGPLISPVNYSRRLTGGAAIVLWAQPVSVPQNKPAFSFPGY
jgi:hypothetical protein